MFAGGGRGAIGIVCNRYGRLNPLNAPTSEFRALGPVNWDGLAPNTTLDQIRPTDRAPIPRPAAGGGLELTMLRWGLVPHFWNRPVPK
jgi:putative SOS response-associated peptidase YedK